MIAVGLLSGGLDSAIAAYLIAEQGYRIIAVNIDTGFISEGRDTLMKLVKRFDMELVNVDIFDEYVNILKHPVYGFGKNMNPCLDCRLKMYAAAKRVMEEAGADFIFTGEVLEQRPFSQNYRSLKLLERESGLRGRLLRPLSALFFPPTFAELDGKIDRSKLLGIKGRSRKLQLSLAEKWGLTEFNSPGGGCLLTDPGFSRRLREWLKTEGGKGEITRESAQILRYGRHIRLSENCKLVVGRNEKENGYIEAYSQLGTLVKVSGIPGPTALLMGDCDDFLETAAKIVARYSDAKDGEEVVVIFEGTDATNKLNKRDMRIIVDKKIKYDMIM